MVSTTAQFLIWNESLLSIYVFRLVGVACDSCLLSFFQEVRSNILSAQRRNPSKTAHIEGRRSWSISLIWWLSSGEARLTPERWFCVNCAAPIIWSLLARHLSPRGSEARHVVNVGLLLLRSVRLLQKFTRMRKQSRLVPAELVESPRCEMWCRAGEHAALHLLWPLID